MRKLIMATMAATAIGAATLAGSAPAAAYDYPWCLQGKQTGIPGDCAYSSYRQCMASASGQYAYCAENPRTAFGQPQPQPRGRRAYPGDYYR